MVANVSPGPIFVHCLFPQLRSICTAMGIFESRLPLSSVSIPDGKTTAIAAQEPKRDTFHDLTFSDLNTGSRETLGDITRNKETVEMLRATFPKSRGKIWGVKSAEVRRLVNDDGPEGKRFREAIWHSSHARGIASLKNFILNPDRALPHPHDLFNKLLSTGQIRLPSEELLPTKELLSSDPARIMLTAEKLWGYSGFEGVAGNFSYSDIEDPPGATKARYHGSDSRAGINVQSRIAWSDIYESALVTRTPIVLSNMEAAADRKSCRLAAAAGVTPFLFSSEPGERLAAASELGSDVFITVRTSASEIRLAKELLRLGANVHIELANSYNPRGLSTTIELKDYIRSENFAEPRFVSLGKSVGGPAYIASVLAGADLVITNRGGSPICSTPEVTGRGLRTWSSCYEMALAQHLIFLLTGKDVPQVADAGIRSGGDITRAATAGAEGGMVGTAFVKTIDSPTEKGKGKDGRWYSFNFGDASRKANGKRQVADQGISGWWAIPENEQGDPRTIRDLATQFIEQIQASVGDGGNTEDFLQLPIQDYSGLIRVPGEHARKEASARLPDQPDPAKFTEHRETRLERFRQK